jgi:Protein of unknown function (DUF2924)
MLMNIPRELAALQRMTAKELRAKYAEVFGEATTTGNRSWLLRRIAWRLQANAEGDLSERARKRAEELACNADIRSTPPKLKPTTAPPEVTATRTLRFQPDDRLPPPGTVITRPYKGDTLRVTILADGFEYDGQVYGSLSAVAKAVTGSHCNGYLFFRLGQPKEGAA